MARNNQLPKSIAKVSSKFGTPYVSIIFTGVLITVLAFALDLKQTVAITSFAILSVHLTVNLSAIRLRRKMPNSTKFRVPLYPIFPVLGLISCTILMFSLPIESWSVAAIVVAISAVLYSLGRKQSEESATHNINGS